jgi:hypothetical protein
MIIWLFVGGFVCLVALVIWDCRQLRAAHRMADEFGAMVQQLRRGTPLEPIRHTGRRPYRCPYCPGVFYPFEGVKS